MYNWAITFTIIALSAAVFAFGGFDQDYASAAKLLVPVFLGLAAVSILLGKRGRQRER
ncbi:hypothetical protein GCM10007421_19050 [Halopseudomonas oceani]|uniref:UPF0391 membrane protein C1949_09665 n=1 Tax=Halopseudomonas oceani TaxID=1708783 RepID=A0A2P4EVI5_9GAMM|nr:DUF1328 domain-containing protein [Halopseudomonas oceani]POB03627.1 DUF1328 domain-containing protein [Halopseudomonas oceani]GGE45072.1 hypothetical protein GCM10007421_19050 [Halopseudomonas oceani]